MADQVECPRCGRATGKVVRMRTVPIAREKPPISMRRYWMQWLSQIVIVGLLIAVAVLIWRLPALKIGGVIFLLIMISLIIDIVRHTRNGKYYPTEDAGKLIINRDKCRSCGCKWEVRFYQGAAPPGEPWKRVLAGWGHRAPLEIIIPYEDGGDVQDTGNNLSGYG